MFDRTYPVYEAAREKQEFSIQRQTLLTVLPVILFLTFLGGGIGLVAGNYAARPNQIRMAKLPVAGDRLELLAYSSKPEITPLVALSAEAANPLSAVATNSKGNWVRIPSLNINVPIALPQTMKDSDVLTSLNSGIAMYPNGVKPGEKGNVFLAGHSTGEPWKGQYRFAFLKIDQLKAGDSILIDYKNFRYTYRVTGTNIVDPVKSATLDSKGEKRTLSLMACWPLWTTKNRLIVNSELAAINPLLLK